MARRGAMARRGDELMEFSGSISTLEELHALSLMVHEVASDWGISEKVLFEVSLIVEEFCSNSVKYGGIPVGVGIKLADSVITIMITDSGKPFDPTEVAVPDVTLPLEERKAGGLGIHFVNHFADTIVYSRENGRNILKIEKKI